MLYGLAGLVLLAVACKNSPKEAETTGGESQNAAAVVSSPTDSLFEEIVGYHDEAMPKMGKLRGFQKTAQQRIDSLAKLKDNASVSLRAEYTKLLKQLKDADKEMMDWMDNFQPEPTFSVADSLKIYYESEKVKAKNMRDHFFEALDSAAKKMD